MYMHCQWGVLLQAISGQVRDPYLLFIYPYFKTFEFMLLSDVDNYVVVIKENALFLGNSNLVPEICFSVSFSIIEKLIIPLFSIYVFICIIL